MLGTQRVFLIFSLLMTLGIMCAGQQQQQHNATSSEGNEFGGGNGKGVVGEEETSQRMSEEQRERQRLQAEARKRRRQRDREREGVAAAKETLQAAQSENCDWRASPLANLRGRVCGVHYKVLGLDRRRSPDKKDIKQAFRQKSLALHPDKNSAPEASTAFKIATDAYECLLSDECKETYDEQLRQSESQIAVERDQIRSQLVQHSQQGLQNFWYCVVVGADYVNQLALQIWDQAGEVEAVVFGEPRPVGRMVLSALLFFKARWLLQLHGLTYFVQRLNVELVKSRGLL